ncbi:MAG: trigger factor [Actinomycetota bacterium]|nr:trigger factor [Actinomycetota bacterium]
MPTTVTTSVTELPESRVRVEAQVDPKEVQRHLERTARRLGEDLRIPGFRKGKVPPGVIIQRLGRDAVLDEAVRDGMGHWYVQAVDEASIAPVGDPHLELDGLPDQGQPLSFSIEVGVRPIATLGDYRGLEVGRREPEADAKEIDDELEQLRDRLAKLETVERPAQDGDFVVMDFTGTVDGVAFEGGTGTDQMVELGRGMLVPGFEEQLTGASAGDERTVEITFPQDYANEDLKGRGAQFAVTVKDVREKRLPALDDDLALEAAGFDTLDELREDVASRLRDTDESKVAADFREAVLDAAVGNGSVEVPAPLVEARARESFEQMVHSLSHQGIAKETYLQITGKTEEELVEESRPQAEQQLRREAVIAAIVAAEGIEISDDDLLEAIEPVAQREEVKPPKLLERLRSQGRLDALRDDLAQRRAIELIAQEATPISVEEAKAKDVLWTPEKEQAGAGAGELWTPGS